MKLQNIIRYVLGIVFLFSAIMKLTDYKTTAVLFANLIGFEILYAKVFLGLLILLEIIISYVFLADFVKNNFIYYSVSGMITIFIITNIVFLLKGYNNCGCFGSIIESSPLVSIIKNILMLYGVYYLKNNTYQKELFER
ncbi:MauE/DoxX family redox-associated membrane protein [Melioribacteraceae bacterium 4301-Me]|uniref:MauE/DoxX family redox-associated membrane protein n=1 Tax=Pyranulibacter aquaticus TaxID=3163344 RepID=UPI00359697B5